MAKNVIKVLVVLVVGFAVYVLHKYEVLTRTLEWVNRFGVWSPFIFIAIYVLSSIFFVPSAIFTFAAGVLFGLWRGIVFSLIGLGIGSVSAFSLGRYLARDWLTRVFSKNKNFHLLDEAVRKKGWKIVLLARLSPISPFLLANYGFGTTKISARRYFLASVIGSIPSTAVYVYLGTLAGSLTSIHSDRARSPFEWALLIVGLMVTVLLTWYIRRVAQTALNKDLN